LSDTGARYALAARSASAAGPASDNGGSVIERSEPVRLVPRAERIDQLA
jgi:hypothetical protein